MEDPAFIRPDRSTAGRRICLLIVLLVAATLQLADTMARRAASAPTVAVQKVFTVARPAEASKTVAPPGGVHPEYSRHARRTVHLYQPIIQRAAQRFEVDPALVKAIIMTESGYDPRAVSRRGAKGLMQLMPSTAESLGVDDSFNPEHNITGGVRYFRQLMNRFDDDAALALAAYNAGLNRVLKYDGIPPFKATRRYVQKVLAYYRCYQQFGRTDHRANRA